jgi:hypothetical protein
MAKDKGAAGSLAAEFEPPLPVQALRAHHEPPDEQSSENLSRPLRVTLECTLPVGEPGRQLPVDLGRGDRSLPLGEGERGERIVDLLPPALSRSHCLQDRGQRLPGTDRGISVPAKLSLEPVQLALEGGSAVGRGRLALCAQFEGALDHVVHQVGGENVTLHGRDDRLVQPLHRRRPGVAADGVSARPVGRADVVPLVLTAPAGPMRGVKAPTALSAEQEPAEKIQVAVPASDCRGAVPQGPTTALPVDFL